MAGLGLRPLIWAADPPVQFPSSHSGHSPAIYCMNLYDQPFTTRNAAGGWVVYTFCNTVYILIGYYRFHKNDDLHLQVTHTRTERERERGSLADSGRLANERMASTLATRLVMSNYCTLPKLRVAARRGGTSFDLSSLELTYVGAGQIDRPTDLVYLPRM